MYGTVWRVWTVGGRRPEPSRIPETRSGRRSEPDRIPEKVGGRCPEPDPIPKTGGGRCAEAFGFPNWVEEDVLRPSGISRHVRNVLQLAEKQGFIHFATFPRLKTIPIGRHRWGNASCRSLWPGGANLAKRSFEDLVPSGEPRGAPERAYMRRLRITVLTFLIGDELCDA